MNEINALVPGTCPHCQEQIVVKLKVVAPELIGIVKAEEVVEIMKQLEIQNDTPKESEAA